MDFLDIAHYKYNRNFFNFWKLDHRRPELWPNMYPLVAKKWTKKKSDRSIFISAKYQLEKWSWFLFYLLGTQKGAGIIQTGPTVIKPFIKKVAHSKTNLKYILSNFPIQLKNWKN